MKRMLQRRELLLGLSLSYLYAFLFVMGRAYTAVERHPLTEWKHYLWIVIIGTILYPVIIVTWEVLDKWNCVHRSKAKEARLAWKQRIIIFGLLFIAWVPCWLAAYPGFFCYDATQEFNSVYTGMLSSHHPILHSMLLTYPMMISERITGDFNGGIVFYCLFQMMIGAGVFTYVVCFLHKYVNKKLITVLAVLYYMFSPVVVLFASCTTKDVMSSLWVTVFVLRFYELLFVKRKETNNRKQLLAFCLLTALVLFSRKNILIALCLFLLVQLVYTKQCKKRILVLVGGIAVYYVCNAALMKVLQAEPSAIAEALSVPAQQIAAVYTYEGGRDAFTDEQWDMLCRAFVEEELEGNYCPWLSDPIKERIESEYVSGHMLEFVRLWLEIFLVYPEHYVNAFNYLTYQSWYPFTDLTGYNNSWYTYQEFNTCFFACTIEAPGKRASVLPGLFERLRDFSLYDSIWKNPVIGMCCSLGVHLWILLFSISYSIYRQHREWLVFLLFPCCLIFTNFMGPIVLVRYYLFLFYLTPVILGSMFCGKQTE